MDNEIGECSEMFVLNRISRRDTPGYKIKADPRHVERVVRELGLEDSKAARLPGSKAERKNDGHRIFDEACVAAIGSIASHRSGGSGKGKGCSIDNVSVETTTRTNKPQAGHPCLRRAVFRALGTIQTWKEHTLALDHKSGEDETASHFAARSDPQ